MSPTLRCSLVWAVVSGFTLSICSEVTASELSFRRDQGHTLNSFVREGLVAAHLVLRGGHRPRILIAFPAGDSGVALWFAPNDRDIIWHLAGPPRPTVRADHKGRLLRGLAVKLAVATGELRIEHALLSSVRVLRDYDAHRTEPMAVAVSPAAQPNGVLWQRDRLDGAAGYALQIEPLSGTRLEGLTLRSASHRLEFRIVALTGEPPLHALGRTHLLTAAARPDADARQVLAFLSYQEKYLAGSWRFDTYFGRDTLLALQLLAPAMTPEALECGLTSVLDRLSPSGEVAHEESIGEFAVLAHLRAGERAIATPVYDYDMVDEDFLLAPLAARVLLEEGRSTARSRALLAKHAAGGGLYGVALVRNLLRIVGLARPFAADPSWHNLIAVKAGHEAGDWRDSTWGLAGGRYPYDVNVALVPAALRASAQLLASHLLDPYVSQAQRRALRRARAAADAWSHRTPHFFAVTLAAADARTALNRYAAGLGLDPRAALASLSAEPLSFGALALDGAGHAIPVMHSDGGFVLLFATPEPGMLAEILRNVTRPFPAGLWTPIGVLISNPAFASLAIQRQFTRTAYHGTVVWSWQQALLAAGIEHQLRRADLPEDSRELLKRARERVWMAIEDVPALRESELWSWSLANSCYAAEPFGSQANDADESDAAQLWSTAFLALRSPAGGDRRARALDGSSLSGRRFCQ